VKTSNVASSCRDETGSAWAMALDAVECVLRVALLPANYDRGAAFILLDNIRRQRGLSPTEGKNREARVDDRRCRHNDRGHFVAAAVGAGRVDLDR
jgi:hypothetical protein